MSRFAAFFCSSFIPLIVLHLAETDETPFNLKCPLLPFHADKINLYCTTDRSSSAQGYIAIHSFCVPPQYVVTVGAKGMIKTQITSYPGHHGALDMHNVSQLLIMTPHIKQFCSDCATDLYKER